MKRKIISLALTLLMAAGAATGVMAADEGATGVMTPYAESADPNSFWNGATFELQRTENTNEWITRELERMSERYHINTVTIYGLENFDDAGSDEYKTHLFNELKRLDMRAVVRIESYDAENFAFTKEDAAKVMESHRALVQFVSKPENRDQVDYFALNMPVDDGTVQANLGGVNSETSKKNQVTYAEEIVRLMREETAACGFEDAKMFLSVFYGWDNTYDIPSYASAGADGYFINNYSYPEGKIPTAEDDDATLINADRLSISMETYRSQYGDAPVVIECGFHTMEYNGGAATNQTAGLVADVAAKRKAMRAMVEFYQQNYPEVRGILYFGYNLFKEEGNPPTVMDWSLEYPTRDTMPAAEGLPENGAKSVEDASSLNGWVVELPAAEDGLTFTECPPVQQLVIRYRADQDAELGLYSGGQLKKTVTLPASSDYTELGVLLTVVEDYDLTLQAENAAGLRIDQVLLLEDMQAEYARLTGSAQAQEDEDASRGGCVTGLSGGEVAYDSSRGGEVISITYRCDEDSVLTLRSGSQQFALDLAASKDYTTLEAQIGLAPGASFSLSSDQESFALDGVQLTGAPAPGGVGAEGDNAEGPLPGTQPEAASASVLPYVAVGVAALALVAAIVAFALTGRKRKEQPDGEE